MDARQYTKPFKTLFQLIYGSEPFEVPSSYPKNIAIERLRLELNKNEYQAMVGRANIDEVIVQRGRALFQPLFNPIFIGLFEDGDQTTRLSGIIRQHGVSQILITALVVFVFLSILGTLIEIAGGANMIGLSLLKYDLLITGIFIAVLALSALLSKNDKTWLRKNITSAVS